MDEIQNKGLDQESTPCTMEATSNRPLAPFNVLSPPSPLDRISQKAWFPDAPTAWPYLLGAEIIAYNFSDIGFAPYGDYWRQLRKVCTLELLRLEINLGEMLCNSSYNITLRTAFAARCKQHAAFISIARKLVEAASGFSTTDLFPSVKLLPMISGMRAKLERWHHDLDAMLETIIEEHRAGNANPKDSDDVTDDLVDVLLNLQDHGGLEFPLRTDNIKAVILDMLIAGTETSSTAVEWAMSELIKNPRILEKAQAEVRQVYDRTGDVNESDLHELKYLKLVMKETLRLHPPLPLLLPRESRKRCEINRYEIPAKTKVIVNAWAIGRDSNYWNEAERFYPERFIDSSVEYKGTNFEFIPFGAGRRICPGISYGMAVVELSLAQLLYHFDWKLPNGLKNEDLDMTETFGATSRRKRDLRLIPIPYHPPSSIQ
ncbi:Premnaspirodiene oxygenase [Gossypium arboreum]|uniref:Premnaspirodiene oxygenase n=1 Tax=Gossypium arboreum TaxID=29729 RepID=A0A0B0PER2_GOSAR|nr:Premnaspirodiene oxygenase [Gossypium arboreum]